MFSVLPEKSSTVLAMALEEEPELLTLYGHNLFLALLVAMARASDDSVHAAAVSLWRTVAQWQLYQMGFRPADLPEHMARPVYDIRGIYSGLLWRATMLYRTQLPAGVKERMIIPETQASHRLGLAFSAGVDEPLWVLLPSEDGGYAIGLTGSVMLGAWWMKCVTDSDKLQAAAQEMLNRFDPEGAIPLLVTCYGDEELLSLWDEESETWRPMGTLSVRRIRGHEHQLDWLRIDELSSGMQPPDSAEVPRPGSRDLGVVVRRLLKRLGEPAEESVRVECSVSTDPDEEVYRVIFSSGDTEVQTFTTESTETLAKTLREPQHVQLRDEEGRVMHWDPKTDVQYDSTGPVRPQVEGSWAFRHLIPYPMTAFELLDAEVGEEVTLVVLEQRTHRSKPFRIGLEGAPEGSTLRNLEGTSLTQTEICMLCACGELFDPVAQSRHRISVDASEVTDEGLLKYLMSDDLGCEVVGLERANDEEETEEEWTAVSCEEGGEAEDGEGDGLENDDREMRLVRAEVYRSRLDHGKRLVVYVTPNDPSGDLLERTVIRRVTHEMTMSRGDVEEAVGRSLRGLRLSEDEMSRACRAAVRVLRSEGVRVVRGPDG